MSSAELPVSYSFRHGFRWWGQAWRMLWRHKAAWAVFGCVVLGIELLIGRLPTLWQLRYPALLPALEHLESWGVLWLLLALAQAQDETGRFEPRPALQRLWQARASWMRYLMLLLPLEMALWWWGEAWWNHAPLDFTWSKGGMLPWSLHVFCRMALHLLTLLLAADLLLGQRGLLAGLRNSALGLRRNWAAYLACGLSIFLWAVLWVLPVVLVGIAMKAAGNGGFASLPPGWQLVLGVMLLPLILTIKLLPYVIWRDLFQRSPAEYAP